MPPLSTAAARAHGARTPREALARHLHDFKRLALGIGIRTGRSFRFATPLRAALPLAVPGTRLSILGQGEVTITGAKDGSPVIEDRPPDLRVEECPVARHGDCEVLLQPFAYNVPVLDFARRAVAEGLDYQRRNRPRVEAALARMEEHAPSVFRQFSELMRIVALKPAEVGTTNNASHSDFPGAIVARPVAHPYYLADVLIHEFHHNRLFFVEELDLMLDDGGVPLREQPRYCSPWRPDRRPLHGILHAVYVFVPCTRFWLAVLTAGSADPATLRLALDRVVRGRLQIQAGAHQVARHARFTAFGRDVFAQLRADADALAAEIDALGLPWDARAMTCREDGEVVESSSDGGPATVKEAIVSHLRGCGPAEQAQEIEATLFA